MPYTLQDHRIRTGLFNRKVDERKFRKTILARPLKPIIPTPVFSQYPTTPCYHRSLGMIPLSFKSVLVFTLLFSGAILGSADDFLPEDNSRTPLAPIKAQADLPKIGVHETLGGSLKTGREKPTFERVAFVPFDQVVINAFMYKVFPGQTNGLDLQIGYCAGISELFSIIHPDEQHYFMENFQGLYKKIGSDAQEMFLANVAGKNAKFKRFESSVLNKTAKYKGAIPPKFYLMLKFIGDYKLKPTQGNYFKLTSDTGSVTMKMRDGTLINEKSMQSAYQKLWAKRSLSRTYLGLAPAKKYLSELPTLMEPSIPYQLETKGHQMVLTRHQKDGLDTFVLFDPNKGETTVKGSPLGLYDAISYLKAPNYDNDPDVHIALSHHDSELIKRTEVHFKYSVPDNKDTAFLYFLKAAQSGNSPTVRAILKSHPALINRTLKDSNGIEISAVSRAAGYGQLEMVKTLYEEFKAQINWVTVGLANSGGHAETIKYLNSVGAKKAATAHPIYNVVKKAAVAEKTEEETHEL